MKTFKNLALMALFFTGITSAVYGQSSFNKKEKYHVVITKLKETTGNYTQRKLYRSFLTMAMKKCPYIKNFHVVELHHADDREVTWQFDVNDWGDITRFYSWMNKAVHSSVDSTLINALTPYRPDYIPTGKITVYKNKKDKELVKNE